MLGQFGDDYRPYMERTGMFLPKPVEAAVGRLLPLRGSSLRAALCSYFSRFARWAAPLS